MLENDTSKRTAGLITRITEQVDASSVGVTSRPDHDSLSNQTTTMSIARLPRRPGNGSCQRDLGVHAGYGREDHVDQRSPDDGSTTTRRSSMSASTSIAHSRWRGARRSASIRRRHSSKQDGRTARFASTAASGSAKFFRRTWHASRAVDPRDTDSCPVFSSRCFPIRVTRGRLAGCSRGESTVTAMASALPRPGRLCRRRRFVTYTGDVAAFVCASRRHVGVFGQYFYVPL